MNIFLEIKFLIKGSYNPGFASKRLHSLFGLLAYLNSVPINIGFLVRFLLILYSLNTNIRVIQLKSRLSIIFWTFDWLKSIVSGISVYTICGVTINDFLLIHIIKDVIRGIGYMTNIKVNVRWMDGYYESFDCTEVRFGLDLLWMMLNDNKNRHIPLRNVRWFSVTPVSRETTWLESYFIHKCE